MSQIRKGFPCSVWVGINGEGFWQCKVSLSSIFLLLLLLFSSSSSFFFSPETCFLSRRCFRISCSLQLLETSLPSFLSSFLYTPPSVFLFHFCFSPFSMLSLVLPNSLFFLALLSLISFSFHFTQLFLSRHSYE